MKPTDKTRPLFWLAGSALCLVFGFFLTPLAFLLAVGFFIRPDAVLESPGWTDVWVEKPGRQEVWLVLEGDAVEMADTPPKIQLNLVRSADQVEMEWVSARREPMEVPGGILRVPLGFFVAEERGPYRLEANSKEIEKLQFGSDRSVLLVVLLAMGAVAALVSAIAATIMAGIGLAEFARARKAARPG